MTRRQTETPRICSFCSKREQETGKLIAGPDEVAICVECVHLCMEIAADEPPSPSQVQETTLVLADGARCVVAAGLREAMSMLGSDDSRIVAFDLVGGGRLAVRRESVRYLSADREPESDPVPRPSWADQP